MERSREISAWNRHDNWAEVNFTETQNKQKKIRISEILDTYQDITAKQLSEEAYHKFQMLLYCCDTAKHSKVNAFIRESWQALSQEEFESFITELLGSSEDTDKQESLEASHAAFDKLAESVKVLNPVGKAYESALAKINALSESWFGADFRWKIEEILKELEDSEVLLPLSADLQEYDKQHGTNNFSIFREVIKELSPRLGDSVALQEQQACLRLWVKNLENVTISKNRLELATKDGFSIQAIKGQKRTLGRLDSKYKLDSTITNDSSLAELDALEVGLLEQQTPLKKRLSTIDNALASIASNTDLEIFKTWLSSTDYGLYIEKGIDELWTLGELEAVLQKERSELNEQLVSVETRAISYADTLVKNLSAKLEKKQKRQKEILNFLHEIGFDRISQETTDKIIASINANSEMKSKYWIQSNIDLENGSLWFEGLLWDESLNDEQREGFARLFNKMITGNENYPVFIDKTWVQFFQSEEDFEDRKPAWVFFDIETFADMNIWNSPINTILDNLKK